MDRQTDRQQWLTGVPSLLAYGMPKRHIKYYATTVLLSTGVAQNVKLTMNNFSWQSRLLVNPPTFPDFPDTGWPLSRVDAMKFPDISPTIRGTCDHFNWYSYHVCTTSVKVNDQTVKFIFNDNHFIMIIKTSDIRSNTIMENYKSHTILLKSLLAQLWKLLGNFPWQAFFPDNSRTFPWLLVEFLTFPWHLYNSLTFPGFPDKWSPCRQVFSVHKASTWAAIFPLPICRSVRTTITSLHASPSPIVPISTYQHAT